MFAGIAVHRYRGLAALALMAFSLAAPAAPGATPPYYSLQVASVKSQADALAILAGLREVPDMRVEVRGDEYAVRFGAFASREDAEQALARYREQSGDTAAFVLRIQKPAPWMLPDTAAADAAAPALSLASATGIAVAEAPVASVPARAEPAATDAPPPARTAVARADAEAPTWVTGPGIGRWWKTAQVLIEDLGWNDGFLLDGATGGRDLYLPVPAGVDASSAQVTLNMRYGDSLIGESTVMLSVNGAPRRTLRRADAGPAGAVQVQLPLTRRDLARDFVHVRFDYTQLADRDVCFSEALAGAWTRIEADSGLTLTSSDLPPSSVRTAWALLPREVVIAADFSSLDADAFEAVFRLASLLRAERHDYRLLPVKPGTPLKDVPAHIVLAEPGAIGAAAAPGSRSLYVSQAGGTARLVLERGNPTAVKVLNRPWPGAGLLDVPDVGAPAVRAKVRSNLSLSELGFTEGERRFHRSTRWDIPLSFGAMGPAMRPDWVQLQVYAPDVAGSGKPTVLSAYYNDRLVYSGTLAGSNSVQSVDFALPRHLLRARNQLSLVAQRDPGPGQCGSVAAAHAISIAPTSRILLKPYTDTPETFADLVPYEATLKIYLPATALAAAEQVIPFLVAAGAQFWPSASSPPPIEFYAPDKPFKPDGPFLVVGEPGSPLEAPVQFDQGRVRLVTADGGQEFAMLEMQPAAEWALLQMAQAGGHAGAWLMAPGGYRGLPSTRLQFEDEDVALLDRDGVQMAVRVGPTRDYEVTYPEADSWFDAAGRTRVLLFIAAWIGIATLIVYLMRVSRRHRDPPPQ